MKIDIRDLLISVAALQSPGARLGWPDDPTVVEIADPPCFSACLDDALRAFRDLRGGADYLMDADLNSYHRSVWVRFVCGKGLGIGDGQMESPLRPTFEAAQAVAAANGGKLRYWGGNNYFDLSLPFGGPVREAIPQLDHLPWDERYRQLLERAPWNRLRAMVFRFSRLADSFAARCSEFRATRVLIPSVGLSVNPWLFAERGLSVVATDAAGAALAALAEPTRWPRLFSRAAFERWDIAEAASYASQGNPDHFTRMPDLENQHVRDSLRSRIRFALADWADLPCERGSVDAIFATNALPRESAGERAAVLREWGRVVRPGGMVFIAQHNFFDPDLKRVVQDIGWVEANLLGREHSAQPDMTGYQVFLSSG
jgi:SAM-dependent methyltransferase